MRLLSKKNLWDGEPEKKHRCESREKAFFKKKLELENVCEQSKLFSLPKHDKKHFAFFSIELIEHLTPPV